MASVPGSTAIDAGLVERFKQALDRLNPEGGKIGLAVSGGPDSMAMLLLATKAIPGGFEVATVDHGLRPEARDECALVVAACKERGVPCEVLTVQVGEGNVQAKAREARYAALSDWAEDRQFAAIATAHHADDQAETLIMRLNRGSGISGLAGVRERTRTPSELMLLIRLLLAFRRSELIGVVKASEVAVANDPSNSDDGFDRVRLRKALAKIDWIDTPGFARSASNLAEAEQALSYYAMMHWWGYVEVGEGRITINRQGPPAIFLRILQRAIGELGGDARGGNIAALRDAIRSGEKRTLGGILFEKKLNREGEVIWTLRPEPPRRTG